MKKITHIVAILFLYIFSSCQKQDVDSDVIKNSNQINYSEQKEVFFNSPESLISYVASAENGYYKEKEIDEIKFSALLKPFDFIKSNELLKSNGVTINPSDDLQYFDLRITVKDFKMEFLKYNLADIQEYNQRVGYCVFEMQKDIFLIDGNDTLSCLMFHFERAYDVVPFGHFILAFAPSKNKKILYSKTLFFHDKLFNKGLIKFTFTPDNLIKVPKLSNL